MSYQFNETLDNPIPTYDSDKFLAGLAQIVDSDVLLTAAEQLAPFESDGLSMYRQQPFAAVLPNTIEQVQKILQLCDAMNVPVVTRGAGTGLSGGALPFAHCLLLVMSKFDQIINIDAKNNCAVVQPGVRNLAISEAVSSLGLYYAPDPSSQIACSIGGNVAENAGGVHCLKYGLTVHNLMAIKAFNISGEAVELGGSGLDSAGLDLMALLTGSEGLLAVITEVTVKLLAKPLTTKTLLVAFDSIDKASDGVGQIIAAGVIPAGLEMMDSLAIQAAEDFAQVGYPRDAKAILLVELDGFTESVDEELELVNQVLTTAGATSIRLAKDDVERAKFWLGRKSAFPAVGRLAPDYYCMDGTIPRRELANVLNYIHELSEFYDLKVANVFHAGDGNLHPLILFDSSKPESVANAEQFGAKILEKCTAVGGTITGEHGVGREKLNQMAVQFTDAEIAQLQAVKSAIDDKGLLNPGKLIPTLRRCQEYRAINAGAGK
jgi:glycolate oxidase